ncbi:hypothetical protein [Roseateles saccharophilus]|uniref:Uncharacterized protein n=1 Tax=Roseateles saccharophilus TaxID=304 RepID=A0A4R3UF67_ROSSA|nr:hypothetical protein [Roseateles saccharophilus]MDG0834953.1 hypothetical protein [Roseateles saccharophilus]TCU88368.1 hypothetical protein EV671_104039 [Roseateles saccharophilus]
MKIERLRGRLDDGTEVVVVKTTMPKPGYPGMYDIPSFALETGESLTQAPGDADLTCFVAYRPRRNITIVR